MGTSLNAKYHMDDIIGKGIEITKCKEMALKAAKTSSPVLIYGETGTGKELIVQAIHNASVRKTKPFIAENCASIPANLLESTLFGIQRGSFTGADNRKGLFEIADGGTLYLDELNSMPMELQGKLLRVLQEGIIRKIGSSLTKKVDVRVITSLNELPEELIKKERLRPDLFYRLNVVRINLPPLSSRKEDIPMLVEHFINKFNSKFKGNIKGITDGALKILLSSNFDGNVRELEHVIEVIFNLKSQGKITMEDLKQCGIFRNRKILTLKEILHNTEKSYIEEALVISKFNITKASEYLGIPRQTLQSKMRKLKIKRRSSDE